MHKEKQTIDLEMRLPWGVQTAIARELGVTQVAVSLVFRGRSTSRRIEEAIASELGMTRDEFLKLRNQEK